MSSPNVFICCFFKSHLNTTFLIILILVMLYFVVPSCLQIPPSSLLCQNRVLQVLGKSPQGVCLHDSAWYLHGTTPRPMSHTAAQSRVSTYSGRDQPVRYLRFAFFNLYLWLYEETFQCFCQMFVVLSCILAWWYHMMKYHQGQWVRRSYFGIFFCGWVRLRCYKLISSVS